VVMRRSSPEKSAGFNRRPILRLGLIRLENAWLFAPNFSVLGRRSKVSVKRPYLIHQRNHGTSTLRFGRNIISTWVNLTPLECLSQFDALLHSRGWVGCQIVLSVVASLACGVSPSPTLWLSLERRTEWRRQIVSFPQAERGVFQ
jgi:hypothetical protein